MRSMVPRTRTVSCAKAEDMAQNQGETGGSKRALHRFRHCHPSPILGLRLRFLRCCIDELFSQMLVEEPGDFFEGFPGLWRGVVAKILCVRLALVDLQHGFDAGLTKLAMNADGVAEQ